MPDDPFEQARRDIERARREYDAAVDRAQREYETTMSDAWRQLEREWVRARAAIEAWRRRGGGPGGERPSPRGPDSPQPSPVRPPNPNYLSGGAMVRPE